MTHTFYAYSDIHPNPWNPNRMTEEMMDTTEASICQQGFIDPVKVRINEQGLIEIIDGEHRYLVLRRIKVALLAGEMRLRTDAVYDPNEGWTVDPSDPWKPYIDIVPEINLVRYLDHDEVSCLDFGRLSRADAMKRTLLYNRIHGDHDAIDESTLLRQLEDEQGLEWLAAGLPFGSDELAERLSLAEFDWEEYLAGLDDDQGGPSASEEDDRIRIVFMVSEKVATFYQDVVENLDLATSDEYERDSRILMLFIEAYTATQPA